MQKDHLIQSIEQRTAEVAGYQTNIENYSRMIDKITCGWCELSAPYKGMDTAQAVEKITDDALLEKVCDLNFRDKLIATLRAERMEQRKAALVLAVLKDQLEECNVR